MKPDSQPGKEPARAYPAQRVSSRAPSPDMARIRRQLGFPLIAAQRAGR
jgi:hypothetical protein